MRERKRFVKQLFGNEEFQKGNHENLIERPLFQNVVFKDQREKTHISELYS